VWWHSEKDRFKKEKNGAQQEKRAEGRGRGTHRGRDALKNTKARLQARQRRGELKIVENKKGGRDYRGPRRCDSRKRGRMGENLDKSD